jgi:hypothetical protein
LATPSIYTLRRRTLPNQRRTQPPTDVQEKDRLRLNLEQRRLERLKESWRVTR